MEEKLKVNPNKKENLPKPKRERKDKKKKEEIFNDSVRADYFRKPDNKKSLALKYLLDLLVIIFLVMYGLILAFAIESGQNKGIPTFAGKAYYEFTNVPSELGTTQPMAIFDTNKQASVGFDIVGYRVYDKNGSISVQASKVTGKSGTSYTLANGETCDESQVVGVYLNSEATGFLYSIMSNKASFIYLCLLPIFIFIVISLTCYYVLYPRKVKINFFEDMFNGENDSTLTSSLATVPAVTQPIVETASDDSITEYIPEDEQNSIPGTNIETFYTTTKSKNGELYALVKKYQDSINDLQEYGATDMDLIRMNMVGNSEFNALLTTTHREKPMTLEEIVAYISTFDNVYCIKKRGAINWTYKYKSKTVMIVRGNNDEFKVSFKVYPDAAEKLNKVYCALEDSSFPSGPYWFMFNDLKNLSAPVAKWLIKESYIISMLQEKKAELLRTDKTCADLGVDIEEIKAQIDSGVNILTYDKFAVIAHKIDKNKLELNTLLDQTIPGVFTENYVKEVFYIVNGRDDLALSLLFAKNASEQLINALCLEIEDACTSSGSNMDEKVQAQIPEKKETVKVVKKQTKRK